jgi:hypothetical protein
MELRLYRNNESPRLCSNSRFVYYRMLKEFQEEGDASPPIPESPKIEKKKLTLNLN